MRVNVSKASISKTFMYGLKVSLQRQLTKSNKISLEFYLNLASAKQFVVALTILAEFATFANLLLPALLLLLLNIFISFNVFSRLTVLMNDFRLKTFYYKSSKSSKSNKTIKTSITSSSKSKTFSSVLTSASTINLKLSATSITLTSSAAAAAFTTSAALFKQSSSKNNNHNRTYNNSSKSNKVFLYYTPRDPRLRIFLKTKHFFNRPQQQQQSQLSKSKSKSKSQEYNCCCPLDKSLFKVLSDLCNYGELIGGGHKSGEYNSGDKHTIVKQLNSANNYNNNNNLNKTQLICDNSTETSDNLIVATTAACAAIETNISANILIVIIIVAVISEYTRELFKSIEILLSFHQNHQELNIFNLKSSFGLHESIL
ncbi:uncharacterized protein LOC135962425 [Calliphora vicina]|uniref:uncharacterized protein LOC135962425 n=1 Tax=Calliphora vicina TaxID=7373 RepID=UPI00325AF524